MQTQEVEIQPNVRVSLRTDAEMLDEVMVVAYKLVRFRRVMWLTR